MTFEKLYEQALAKCATENERTRVAEEKALIEKRGWQNYIAFCIDVLNEIKACPDLDKLEISKSAIDSYIVHLNTSGANRDFLLDEKKEKVFFNDALRLTLSVHKIFVKDTNAYRLDSILTSNMKKYGLCYEELLRNAPNEFECGSPEAKENLIVVSNGPIPPADMEAAKKVVPGVKLTEEECELALKYLIVKVQLFFGL